MINRFVLCVFLVGITLSFTQEAGPSDALFKNPSSRYGIRCWWWWLNGNVTKEAITHDLEEMKAKGFSGACIVDAGGQNQRENGDVPEGPMFGTPAWRELYRHAVQEAARLGLTLSMGIQSGWNLGGPDITPEEATKHITWADTTVKGPTHIRLELPIPKIKDGYYREIAVIAYPKKDHPKRKPIRDFKHKNASEEAGWANIPDTRPLLTDEPSTPGEEDATTKSQINLTNQTQNGVVEWDVPAGEWSVLRLGYTPSDAHVSTSSGKWQGRVLDHMSEKYFNRYWDTNVEPLLKEIGPLAGKTLKYLQTDSWELGGINWTDDFAEQFKKYRGYDITPYLPILAGKIVDNREVTTRFLADFRKTVSDCIADHHYALFAKRAAKHGLGIQPESAGPHAGPFDGLKNYGHSAMMMSEFWSPSPHRPTPDRRFFVKQAASAAHIYNVPLVGAESFTTIGPHWNDVIWSAMKPSADHEFCSGLNMIFLHTFTCSPKEMGLPGQEYFAGTHFNPNVTWWNESGAFVKYLSRIQYLAQNSRFVGDVLYYYGDHVPNIGRLKEDDPAKVLPGYDYDLLNEDRLLALTVKDGKLTFSHGQSYQVLVLPDHGVLSLKALRKIHELVQAGATIIGPKTTHTVSLEGYPMSEKEVQKLADDIWGNETEHHFDKGRAFQKKSVKDVLLADGIQPDFQSDGKLDYIHYQWGKADWYFVSNQNNEAKKAEVTLRISGKQPELWNAVTGEIRPVTVFRQENGRTSIPLEFTPAGSWIILFRKPITITQQGKATSNFVSYQPVKTIEGAWQVHFDPKWGGPANVTFKDLTSWTKRPEAGINYYSGKATYQITFDCSVQGKQVLDLGDVQDVGIAHIRLNGKDLGTLWCPPYRVSVVGILKPKGNKLEVDVINSWRNRLVGDRGKPQNERFTKTNILIRNEWELLDAGLLGPVRILKGE
ncbi:MAG: glycosyl hydrolase [Siphonobacter sp.]